MTEWREVKLGDVAKFSQGIQVPIEKQSLIPFENSVRFIRIVDLTNPNEPKRYISNPGERYIISENDLAMVRYGSPGLPVLGMNGAIANNLFRIIPNNLDEIYPKYLFYYFLIPSIQNYLLTVQPSSTMPSITFNVMKNMSISLPSVEVQRKIAGVLGALDDKIELNNKINQNLELQAQALFKSWFVDFEPFGGKMPDDWKIYKLGDFLPVITGKKNANVSSSKGKYPFFSCSQDIAWTDDYSFEGNAILVAGNGDFNVKFYNGKFEAYQRTYVLIPHNPRYTDWLYYAVKRNLSNITSGARGSVISFITKGNLENFEFAAPSDLDSFNVIDVFSSINKIILSNKKENEKLSLLRDTLLPKLMSGEIDVSNVDISDPIK